MATKICVRCKVEKPISDFYLKKNGKYHSYCNQCKNQIHRDYRITHRIEIAKYRERTKDIKLEKDRLYRIQHADRVKGQSIRYYLAHKDELRIKHDNDEFRDRRRKTRKRWVEKNRVRYNSYFSQYHKDKPSAKLAHAVRTSINRVLDGKIKHFRSEEILGCSFEFFKCYLESQFVDGMTWDNHGMGEGNWNIDHTPPLAYYNHECPLQHAEAFRWYHTNPKWTGDNISKNSWYNGVRYYYEKTKL
jgi:hypothetical protein